MNKANEKEKAMYKAMFSPDSKAAGDKKSAASTGVCISVTPIHFRFKIYQFGKTFGKHLHGVLVVY